MYKKKKVRIYLIFSLAIASIILAMSGIQASPEGDVQVTLTWDSTADLDFYVTDPLNETIYYGNKRAASGGGLDHDDKCGDPGNHEEIISWPPGKAPNGRYSVAVKYHAECKEEGITEWNVTIRKNGKPMNFSGFVFAPGELLPVTTFVLGESFQDPGGNPINEENPLSPAESVVSTIGDLQPDSPVEVRVIRNADGQEYELQLTSDLEGVIETVPLYDAAFDEEGNYRPGPVEEGFTLIIRGEGVPERRVNLPTTAEPEELTIFPANYQEQQRPGYTVGDEVYLRGMGFPTDSGFPVWICRDRMVWKEGFNFERCTGTPIIVELTWDIPEADLDLSVKDPFGNVASFETPDTPIDGHLSTDMQIGPGSEKFTLLEAPSGNYKIRVRYYGTVAAAIVEDFETCDFSKLPWRTNAGIDHPPEVHSGNCSAEMGPGEYLEVTLTVGVGNITFFRNVNEEDDELRFLIDGKEKGRWGYEPAWVQETFAVSVGIHTFRWENSGTSCCVEVDDITFPGTTATEIPYIVKVTIGEGSEAFTGTLRKGEEKEHEINNPAAPLMAYVSTDSSGKIPNTLIWEKAHFGDWDIIIDMDESDTFTPGDIVWQKDLTGIVVAYPQHSPDQLREDLTFDPRSGRVKNEFWTTESIRVRANPDKHSSKWWITNVAKYVVKHQTVWNNGNSLDDVTKLIEKDIARYFCQNQHTTLVASKLPPGDYDVVIDVNRDGRYDVGVDYLDDGNWPGGPGYGFRVLSPFRSAKEIQDKIDTVPDGVQTVIRVAPNTYEGKLVISGKKVIILEATGRVVLRGDGTSPVIEISDGARVTLKKSQTAAEGFTITGGGGGILAVDSPKVNIKDSVISGNSEGGIILRGSSGVIGGNNRIQSNRGTGISIRKGSSMTITGNNVFQNNDHGIEVLSSKVRILNNIIRKNKGCGIFADRASTVQRGGNTVKDNEGGDFCGNVPEKMKR
jgi:parallel beta-helix repeat protein